MPRTRTQPKNVRPPGPRNQLRAEIEERFGFSVGTNDLGSILGLSDRHAIARWIKDEGLEAVEINGRRKYLASDVARVLDNSKIRTAT